MRKLLAFTAMTVATLVVPAAGVASAAPGRDFGQHVATCAQTHGFDGTLNPGMHLGFAGWDGSNC